MLHYRMSSLSDGMNSTHNKIPLCDVLSGCTTKYMLLYDEAVLFELQSGEMSNLEAVIGQGPV